MNELGMLRSIDGFLIDVKRRSYRWMELKPGDRVLDAGCGLGLDVERIRHLDGLSIDALGIDLRYGFFKRSWEVAARQGTAFVAADAALLPFKENTFDVVWADRLLQHVDRPAMVLLELKRVSKADCRIVLADSDHTSARVLCNGKVCGQRLMHFRASTIKNKAAGRMLKTWCEEAGLRVIDDETIDIDISSLQLAKQLGLFFGGWDAEFRRGSRRGAGELGHFLTTISRCDQLGAFRFSSEFHIVSARKR
jgi:ubiquinone/menaquinone biosynthesis C-methylase UbiE